MWSGRKREGGHLVKLRRLSEAGKGEGTSDAADTPASAEKINSRVASFRLNVFGCFVPGTLSRKPWHARKSTSPCAEGCVTVNCEMQRNRVAGIGAIGITFSTLPSRPVKYFSRFATLNN